MDARYEMIGQLVGVRELGCDPVSQACGDVPVFAERSHRIRAAAEAHALPAS